MKIKAQLENELKEAMRSGNDLRKRTIRMVLASIKNAEIERGDRSSALDDAAVLALVQKEIKSRQESISDSQRAGRPDLEEAFLAESSVLEEFLPAQLGPAEVEELARQAIAEVGATSPREMGQVMKILLPRIQGQASGDQVSQAVRKLLQP